MKKVIVHVVLLSVIGMMIGWFIWPFEMDLLIYGCKDVDPNIQFVATTINGAFLLRIKNGISCFVLAWFALLVHAALVRFKGLLWSFNTFYKIFGFVLVGYVLCTILFVVSLLYSVKNSTQFSISENIKNDFSIESLNVYQWGIWGAIISCGFCFFLIKRSKSLQV